MLAGNQPDIDRSGIGWEQAYSSQNSLILPRPCDERKSGLVMSRLIGELIVNAAEHDNYLFPTKGIPGLSGNSGIVVACKSTMGHGLIGKNSSSGALNNGIFSIFVTYIVTYAHGAYPGMKYYCRSLGLHRKGWQMARILNGELERDGILILFQNDSASRLYIGGIDPWSLFGLHFVQLTLHGAILKRPNSRSNDGQNSYGDGGVGRSAGKTILGIFFLTFGAALMKLAFYLGDTPRPQWDDRWLSWGIGCCAGLLIAQGTILTLSGNWLP
jgi:hypothetical protein